MNLRNSAEVNEYQRINVQSEVATATPHRLIQLLMDRFLSKVAMARGHMMRENTEEKGRHIGDAISIINGLQASLNYKADRKLAQNFDDLYDYMSRTLFRANLEDDPQLLVEVGDIMRQLKEAWDAIEGVADS